MKLIIKNLILIPLSLILITCSTSQKVKPSSEEFVPLNKEMEELFSAESLPDEAVRVYVSSTDYVMKQTGYSEEIEIIDDVSGRNAMSEEISQYDMVDMFTIAIYKVTINKESGSLSHIRPVRPSKVSEINKLIIDDITRIKFKLKESESIEDVSLTVRYGIKLHKKKSREEIKKILKENVRE